MHTDELVELRNQFLDFFQETYWISYEKKERQIRLWVDGFFRVLHVIVLVSVLGIAFASVRGYIPKQWWILSVALAILWIAVEYINLQRIDNWLLSKTYKKMFQQLKTDQRFLDYIQLFEKKDIVPPGFNTALMEHLILPKSTESIDKLRQMLYYLKAIKSFEEMAHDVSFEYNAHVPERDQLFD